MTPKEKAKELVEKMHIESDIIYVMSKSQAKKCALIAVNEIIKALRKNLPEIGLGKGYWHSVKQEIEKM
jgi:hypothetical protein